MTTYRTFGQGGIAKGCQYASTVKVGQRPGGRQRQAQNHCGAAVLAGTESNGAEFPSPWSVLQRAVGQSDDHSALARGQAALRSLGNQYGGTEIARGTACGGSRCWRTLCPAFTSGVRWRVTHQRLRVRNDALNRYNEARTRRCPTANETLSLELQY